jgi:prohibitin 2
MASDRQNLDVKLAVLWHIPDANVIKVFTDYHGEPFEVLVGPRLQEAVKEATHARTADQILAERETVKNEVVTSIRAKVGDTVVIDDVMIVNVGVSKELQAAIVAKTVAQQEIATAEQNQKKATVNAETARVTAQGVADAQLIAAKAAAKSIEIRGEALRSNANVVDLELIEKWDGTTPQIVGSGSGISLLLPAVTPHKKAEK